MEKEDLIERYYKELFNRGIKLTEHGRKYINGDIEKLSQGVTVVNKRTHYICFFPFIINELNGENNLLAKRMLKILYYIDEKQVISAYDRVNDIELCAKIDVKFGDLFRNVFTNFFIESYMSKNIFNSSKGYEICEIFYKYYKKEVIEYTKDLFKYSTDDLIDKNPNVLYPILAFGEIIYLDNKGSSKIYLEKVIECLKSMALTREVAILWLKIFKESREATNFLKENIINNPEFTVMIYSTIGQDNFLNFLKENNLPIHPHYAMIVSDYYYGAGYHILFKDYGKINKGKLFNHLYREDRETFYNTYKYLSNIKEQAIYSLNLLSIMCKNGYALEECKKQKFKLMKYSEEVLNGGNLRNNPYQVVIDNKLSEKNNLKKFINHSGLGNMELRSLIKVFSVYYDYEENARKFIDFIIESVVENKNFRNISFLFSYFIFERNKWLNEEIEESINFLLNKGFTYNDIFFVSCLDTLKYSREEAITKEIIAKITNDKEELVIDFLDDKRVRDNIEITMEWIQQIYEYNNLKDYKPILKLIKSKSKKVRDLCERIISENENSIRETLEEAIPKLKGEQLKLGKRVIKQWDNEHKYGKDFKFTSNEMILEFVEDNYDVLNEKLTNWITDSEISSIRFKSSEEFVNPKIIRYIIMEYMALKEPYRIKLCDKIIEKLNRNDVENTLENIYQEWLNNGADTKRKNITIPYGIYANDEQILNLRKQIEIWAKESRGAIGAYTVNSLALNGGKIALLIVDEMGRKFPNAMVKKVAKKGFAYAAKVLDVPIDELSDKIIPNLDFNQKGEKELDYGSRKFRINLEKDFTISIFDESKNKFVKSPPKPNSQDNIEKAEESRKEFSYIKKQIRTIVQTQKARLERAFMNGRVWREESFRQIFVENPIMHIFAEGLIWGKYENGKLKESFRYMEDGSFMGIDEEEYLLPKEGLISLVHPMDLKKEDLQLWRNQLKDYEIEQPMNQLQENILELEERDIEGKKIIKFIGKSIEAGKIISVAKKNNMVRGEVLDGGGYEGYYIVDEYLKIAVSIKFEYMYIGIDVDEDVNMGEIIFYKIEDENINNIEENEIIEPDKVPKRFLNSILNMFN